MREKYGLENAHMESEKRKGEKANPPRLVSQVGQGQASFCAFVFAEPLNIGRGVVSLAGEVSNQAVSEQPHAFIVSVRHLSLSQLLLSLLSFSSNEQRTKGQ